MYEQILKEMREKVHTRQYIMTLHAEDEMVIITVFRGISGEKP